MGLVTKLIGYAQSHDKVFILFLIVCLPVDVMRTRAEAKAKQLGVRGGGVDFAARRALGMRGGSFDFRAREAGELCGIAEPEKAVVGAIRGSTTRLVAALGIRGGSFDFMARESGELCGIAEPEKAVVGAIRGSALGRALGLDAAAAAAAAGAAAPGAALGVRGGAFDFRARETGELVGIRKPEKAVVRAIKTQVGRFCRAIGLHRLRPAKLALPPRRV